MLLKGELTVWNPRLVVAYYTGSADKAPVEHLQADSLQAVQPSPIGGTQ